MDKWGLVQNYPEVQFIQTPEPVGAAEARNIGIVAARVLGGRASIFE
jgi:hypothetical protein